MNRVLKECNSLLRKHQHGREWVIVLEDFEKIGLTASVLKELFTGLRPGLQELDGHFIVVIPSWLYFSDEGRTILPPRFQSFPIPDIAVYQRNTNRTNK